MVSVRSVLLATLASLSATGVSAGCGTDNCLQAARKHPWINCEFSSLCQNLLHSTPKTKTVYRTATCHKTITAPGTTRTATSVGTTLTVTKEPSTAGVSLTATVTAIQTVTQTPTTVFPTITVTISSESNYGCTTTVTSAGVFTTSVIGYRARSNDDPTRRDLQASPHLDERDEMALIPRGHLSVARLCNEGCDGRRTPFTSRLSSACSCFLTTPTKYKTTTVTQTATHTGQPHTTVVRNTAYTTITAAIVTTVVTQTVPVAVTIGGDKTVTSVVTQTATSKFGSCTRTSTSTVYTYGGGGGGSGGALTCGAQTFSAVPTASTSGTVSCTIGAPPPGSTNGLLRIEGLRTGEGTIFEGCVAAGPRSITTPSGGTHPCDGTNNAANSYPGSTPTDQLDEAARISGFGFDGTWYNQYEDFFISSISATTQNSNQFWGILSGLIFTPVGGCQFISQPDVETEWIFDAFSYQEFIKVSPGYAAAEAGSGSVTVTVTTSNGNGRTDTTRPQASIGDQITGADGTASLEVPSEPGCYQYKAIVAGSPPSNGFFLAVLPAGSFA